MKMRINKIIPALFTLISAAATGCLTNYTSDDLNRLDAYNVVWESQSKNSSESMPLGGGDIGCNVWVENGELLFYFQRSGSLSENGEYLKLGRIRIKLSPNPFEHSSLFRQVLILKDGFIRIKVESPGNDALIKTEIDLWLEFANPVIHVDIN